MTDAYVMLNCELGAEEKIIEQLKELEQVVDVFETIGTHDMMVKLQGDNFEKIREIVSWNIQKLDKVRSTATLIKKIINSIRLSLKLFMTFYGYII